MDRNLLTAARRLQQGERIRLPVDQALRPLLRAAADRIDLPDYVHLE